jgi:hypothetical protein
MKGRSGEVSGGREERLNSKVEHREKDNECCGQSSNRLRPESAVLRAWLMPTRERYLPRGWCTGQVVAVVKWVHATEAGIISFYVIFVFLWRRDRSGRL